MSLILRSPVADDAAAAGVICYHAFKTICEQHGYPPDFAAPEATIGLMTHLLSRSDVHGVIADLGGRVVGSNFLWEGGQVAGVGPITVEPAQQNAAVGRQLMLAVLARARLKGFNAIRLVQGAYHGRSLALYTKLGFVSREPLAVMQGPALGFSIPGYVVRAATPADQAAIDTLCQWVHGHNRAAEAAEAIRLGGASVVEHEGRITAYTTGIGFFGHAVGDSPEAVKALIAAAASFPGPGFLLPIRNTILFRWCLEQGLKVVEPMTLMSIGPYNEPQGSYLPSILY
jgi:predicted N-acetyltransferase YhbS